MFKKIALDSIKNFIWVGGSILAFAAWISPIVVILKVYENPPVGTVLILVYVVASICVAYSVMTALEEDNDD